VRTVPRKTPARWAPWSDFADNPEAGVEDTGPVTIYDIQAAEGSKVRIRALPRLTPASTSARVGSRIQRFHDPHEAGTHEELMELAGHYAELFQLQAAYLTGSSDAL
jgi:hypothetical protein